MRAAGLSCTTPSWTTALPFPTLPCRFIFFKQHFHWVTPLHKFQSAFPALAAQIRLLSFTQRVPSSVQEGFLWPRLIYVNLWPWITPHILDSFFLSSVHLWFSNLDVLCKITWGTLKKWSGEAMGRGVMLVWSSWGPIYKVLGDTNVQSELRVSVLAGNAHSSRSSPTCSPQGSPSSFSFYTTTFYHTIPPSHSVCL